MPAGSLLFMAPVSHLDKPVTSPQKLFLRNRSLKTDGSYLPVPNLSRRNSEQGFGLFACFSEWQYRVPFHPGHLGVCGHLGTWGLWDRGHFQGSKSNTGLQVAPSPWVLVTLEYVPQCSQLYLGNTHWESKEATIYLIYYTHILLVKTIYIFSYCYGILKKP